MAALKLEHSDVAEHQVSIMQQSREFWMEGHLCDVVLKSQDGTEHRCHSLVLSAASKFLKNLLVGPFLEADQVRQGKPVEMAASAATVSALLDYLYGGQPEMQVEDSLELLRLADAYELPKLTVALEAKLCGWLANAPAESALKLLQHAQSQSLYDLQAACEDKVAANFESCTQHPDFLKLSPGQLAKLLPREDLVVSREDVVLKAVFTWFNSSKDRAPALGVLLQQVDFPSISLGNLSRIGHFAASLGPNGTDLQREVAEAVRAHRKRSSGDVSDAVFQPKRRCLSNWSPDLGASTEDSGKLLFSTPHQMLGSMQWHNGTIYAPYSTKAGNGSKSFSIMCWKPGDSELRTVVGEGTTMAGINDLSLPLHCPHCEMAVLPDGEILVAVKARNRLVGFKNGIGRLLLSDSDLSSLCCSPNGVVYGLHQNGQEVSKLVGSTLQPLFDSKDLPAELQFKANSIFVTKEETLYLTDTTDRILRISAGESKPVAVGKPPDSVSKYFSVFVGESGKIYICDSPGPKVLAFHPGDTTFTEVVRWPKSPDWRWFQSVLVQGRSLYVSVVSSRRTGVYEYFLPPELQLE